jgi:hypothetical protein
MSLIEDRNFNLDGLEEKDRNTVIQLAGDNSRDNSIERLDMLRLIHKDLEDRAEEAIRSFLNPQTSVGQPRPGQNSTLTTSPSEQPGQQVTTVLGGKRRTRKVRKHRKHRKTYK